MEDINLKKTKDLFIRSACLKAYYLILNQPEEDKRLVHQEQQGKPEPLPSSWILETPGACLRLQRPFPLHLVRGGEGMRRVEDSLTRGGFQQQQRAAGAAGHPRGHPGHCGQVREVCLQPWGDDGGDLQACRREHKDQPATHCFQEQRLVGSDQQGGVQRARCGQCAQAVCKATQ